MSRAGSSSTSVRPTEWCSFGLACLALAAATAVLGVSAAPPSSADLAQCPKSCGGVNISYPLGIGAGCFRPGFEVTCNRSTRPSKLFLANDTTTQIVEQIPGAADVSASIVFNIATRPGASGTYNRSWVVPGRSIIISSESTVVIVGCGFEAFLFDTTTGPGNLLGYCASMCNDMAALEKEAEEGDCNGMGCCSIDLYRFVSAFTLSIVQKKEAVPAALVNATVKAFLETRGAYTLSMLDLLSDKVNESTIGAATANLWAVMTDQPNCGAAEMHADELYACASNSCKDYGDGIRGYWCDCLNQFYGNPYLDGGCTQEYNPSHGKLLNCSRSCGNTRIPFPFGLEPECSANANFHLNCTSNKTLIGQSPVQYQVVNISIDEGLLFANKTYDPKYIPYDEDLLLTHKYPSNIEFTEQYGIWKWVISNTTCDMATKNQKDTEYACISANSECTNVTQGHVYIGYRCKCSYGYEGNPYISNGCNAVAIGLGCGFGVLALTLSSTIMIQQWRRHI